MKALHELNNAREQKLQTFNFISFFSQAFFPPFQAPRVSISMIIRLQNVRYYHGFKPGSVKGTPKFIGSNGV